MTPTFDPALLARLHEDLGSDAAATREIVAAFLESTPDLVAEGRRAAAAGDRLVVQRVAHTLKSSAAMMGAARLSELSRALEERATVGGGSAAAAMEEIAGEYERARPQIEAWAARLT